MRGRLMGVLVAGGLLAPASAFAVGDGGIDIVSRPSGFGALPFDGINRSGADRHALSADGCRVVFTSENDVLSLIDDNKQNGIYVADRCAPGHPVQLVNTTQAGVAADGDSFGPSISADGQKVAFTTTARNLLPPGTTVPHAIVVKNLSDGSVTTASRADGPIGAVAQAFSGVISGDGTAVAFKGDGAIHAGNADGVADQQDVYVRYLGTDSTRMASVTKTSHVRGGADGAFDINYDGTAVALITDAGLDSNDSDGSNDVYLARSVNSGTVQIDWVSYTVGNTSGAQSANSVAIAGDGKHVAFTNNRVWTNTCDPTCAGSTSQYTDSLTPPTGSPEIFGVGFPAGSGAPTHVFWTTDRGLQAADTNGEDDLYVRDLSNLGNDETGLSMPVPHAANGVFGSDVKVGDVAIFVSNDPALPGTDGRRGQVFARSGATTTPLSIADGETRRGTVDNTSIEQRHAVSQDGRFVVMETDSQALGAAITPPGGGIDSQIIVRDVAGGTTSPASMGDDGKPANRYADTASIDGAGDRVVFESGATNLVPGPTNDAFHIYLYDLLTGTTRRVDHLADGSAPAMDAHDAVLSLDGTKVVFISRSPDLPDANGNDHAYLADLATGLITAVDRTQAGLLGDGDVREVDISADASRVAFISVAKNLGGFATSDERVFVKDVGSGALTFASVPESGTPPVAARSLTLSGDASRVGWVDDSPAFGYGSDGLEHVFVRDLAGGTTSLASTGGPTGPGSYEEAGELDGTGAHLAFTRRDATGVPALLLRDLGAGTTTDLLPGVGRYSFEVSVSPDGHCLALNSNAANVLATGNPSPDFDQVYLKAVGADCPPVPPGGGPGGGENPDRTPPVISRLRMTRKRFAVATKRTALVSRRARRGSAFQFTLSENARTSIAIARALPGRRSGKRCVKPRKGLKRRCTRYAVVATLTRTKTKQGANKVAFTGRLGARRLKPGIYRATVGAVDAAGNRAKPRRVTFRIVRR